MKRYRRSSFFRIVLIAMLFVPIVFVGFLWAMSLGDLVWKVYDSGRHESWSLYDGEILIDEGVTKYPPPIFRFRSTVSYLDYPEYPDRRISLWYLTIPASLMAAFPALWIMRRWVKGIRRRRRGLCVECAYDLKGNVSGTCPECGCATKACMDEFGDEFGGQFT